MTYFMLLRDLGLFCRKAASFNSGKDITEVNADLEMRSYRAPRCAESGTECVE